MGICKMKGCVSTMYLRDVLPPDRAHLCVLLTPLLFSLLMPL